MARIGRINRLLPKVQPPKLRVLSTTIFGRAVTQVSATLEQRIKAILNKYAGTLVLAGPEGLGIMGFLTNNYKESTGQTIAVYDQQVGFIQDAANVSSGNQLAAGDFSNPALWSVASGWAVASGELAHTAAGTNIITTPYISTAGKTYRCTFRITSQSVAGNGVSIRLGSSNLTPRNGVGTYTEVFTQSVDGTIVAVVARGGTGDWLGTVDDVTVEELPGDHLTSATAGFQPFLRRVPKTLGPELVVNGNFSTADSWNLGVNWVISAGSLIASAVAAGQQANQSGLALDSSKFYAISIQSPSLAGSVSLALVGGVSLPLGPAMTIAGTYSHVVQPNVGNNTIRLMANATSTGGFDNCTIREVLDWAYVWQFDGIDDRLLFNKLLVPSGNDFYQGFAITVKPDGLNKTFADLSTNPLTGSRIGSLRIGTNNRLQAIHVNEAGSAVSGTGLLVEDNQNLVVEAVRVGTNHKVYADGVLSIDTALVGTYNITASTLGGRGLGTSEPFRGNIYGVVVLNGTPDAGERTDLLSFLGILQGRSLV